MRFHLIALAAILLMAGSAQAHFSVTSTPPEGPFVPGATYTVPTVGYVNCAVIGAEYEDGQTLTFGIANAADYEWLETTETEVTVSLTDCAPVENPPAVLGVPIPVGLYNVFEVDVEMTLTDLAPAFIGAVTIQPGAFGETNEGGSFDLEVAYVPDFTASLDQADFDYEDGSGVLTVPIQIEHRANGPGTFTFDVTSDLPDGVVAHIQETLSAGAPYVDGVASSRHTVELHFSSGPVDHSDHGMEDMDHDAMGHHEDAAWDDLDITVTVTLASDDDSTLVSEAQEVAFSVHRVATEMEHDHSSHDHNDTDEGFLEKVGIPGPGIALVFVGVAAIALMRRV